MIPLGLIDQSIRSPAAFENVCVVSQATAGVVVPETVIVTA
jgi:hypothetical protein